MHLLEPISQNLPLALVLALWSVFQRLSDQHQHGLVIDFADHMSADAAVDAVGFTLLHQYNVTAHSMNALVDVLKEHSTQYALSG